MVSVIRSLARRAVAGDKLTKFVNTAGDDCVARDARALLYPVRLHRESVLSLLALILLRESSNLESGGFAQRRWARAQAGSRGLILMKLRT